MTELADGPVANLRIGAARDGARVDPLAFASMGQARTRAAALSIRDFLVIGSAIAFIALLGLLYMLQSAQITRLAYEVNDQKAALQALLQTNTVLEAEIAVLTRLDRIEARAEQLGMEPAASVLYLHLPGDTAAGALAGQTPAASEGE